MRGDRSINYAVDTTERTTCYNEGKMKTMTKRRRTLGDLFAGLLPVYYVRRISVHYHVSGRTEQDWKAAAAEAVVCRRGADWLAAMRHNDDGNGYGYGNVVVVDVAIEVGLLLSLCLRVLYVFGGSGGGVSGDDGDTLARCNDGLPVVRLQQHTPDTVMVVVARPLLAIL